MISILNILTPSTPFFGSAQGDPGNPTVYGRVQLAYTQADRVNVDYTQADGVAVVYTQADALDVP